MPVINEARRRGVFGRRGENDPPTNIEEAAARTEDALREMEKTGTTEVTTDERPDPAPTAAALAEERANQLIGNISSHVLGELKGLRDQIDDLMRDVHERRDTLRDAICAHAEFAETAVEAKMIIAESIAKMRANFERSNTPLPPIRKVRN